MNDKLTFSGYTCEVDAKNLTFNEATLSEYIQKEGGFYDHFGAYLALAEKNLQNKEMLYEKVYSEKFIAAKENGAAVEHAKAMAKVDGAVLTLQEEVIEAQFVVNRLKQHLRAWDKNHDNAQSMGHMLRKQMDKLHGDIMMPRADDTPPSVLEFETTLSRANLY